MRVLCSSLLAVTLLFCEPIAATAQDDWGLTREPRGRTPRPRDPRTPRTRTPRTGTPRTRAPRAPRTRARTPTPRGPGTEGGPDRNEALIARYHQIVEADPRETFAFRRLLDLYRERDGNIDRLVATLNERVVAEPEAYPPRMLLGHILRAQTRWDEARASYRRALELRPDDPAPQVSLAQVEQAAGDLAAARTHYDAALESTRDRLAREELLRAVADLAMTSHDFEGARGYYEQLGRGGEASLYLRTEYARALATARQWELAVTEYERVIRSLRGDNRVLPPILVELSRAQLERGDAEPSIETLDRALRIAGRQAGIRSEIYDQMLAAYRRADRLADLAERLRGEAGRGFESNELLGRIEDELGNDDEALAAYRRAIRARSRDIDTRLRVIQLLSRSGRLDEVVEEYRALIRSAPREPRFVIELAQLLVQTDHRDDALQLLRDTGRRHGRDPVVHQQLAELYSRWGEDDLAASEIELLARIDPHDPAHVIALGAQQFATGHAETAIATWRRILEVESDRARGQATFAGILADHDLLPQAVEAYREAVRLDPEELTYVRGLATTLERQHNHVLAERQWTRVLELAGDDRIARREARERIVGIWQRSRRLDSQIADLERRFAANPEDGEAGRFLAEAYRRQGAAHQGDAERVLTRIVAAEPGDVESLLALERIRRHRGDLAGAIDVLRRLRDADARRASTYLQQMAEHALALYRDEEAVQYAAEAVQRNPEDASAHRRLGDLYRARQDMDRAIASYSRALELNERLYPVYFELAEIHLARSAPEQADRLYRTLLRATPDDDLVARAARASIQINLGAGTLADLERDVLPLTLENPQRPVFRRTAVELYDAYAGPLVVVARRGGPDGELARRELQQIGTRAIKPLLEALADPDPAQRRVSLDLLGDLGNPNAAAPLLSLAENDALELHQRMRALTAAGTIAPEALVPRLSTLATSGDARLRPLASWALARVGGRDGVRALHRLLSSPDSGVRGFAAIGLGLHPERGTAHALAEQLRSEQDADVAFAATWALGRVGGPDDARLLTSVLNTRGGVISQLAAEALGRIGGDEAHRTLIHALFDPDPDLRRSAARALRATAQMEGETPSELPDLELPTPRPFERVRDYVPRMSARAAVSPGTPELAPHMDSLVEEAQLSLAGPGEDVTAALAVLSSRTDGLGLGPLTADMEEWSTQERSAASETLAAIATRLIPDLVATASHPDAVIRVPAVRLLARLPGPEAEAAVAAALESSTSSVQRAALEALAEAERAPGAEVTTRLAGIVTDHSDWSMRTRAAGALSRAEGETARSALREAVVEDPYAFVRQAAARALRRRPTAADVAVLARALESDSEARVRLEAAAALIAAGGDAADHARQRAARDADPQVRALVR